MIFILNVGIIGWIFSVAEKFHAVVGVHRVGKRTMYCTLPAKVTLSIGTNFRGFAACRSGRFLYFTILCHTQHFICLCKNIFFSIQRSKDFKKTVKYFWVGLMVHLLCLAPAEH
jgi:hypothetical protein